MVQRVGESEHLWAGLRCGLHMLSSSCEKPAEERGFSECRTHAGGGTWLKSRLLAWTHGGKSGDEGVGLQRAVQPPAGFSLWPGWKIPGGGGSEGISNLNRTNGQNSSGARQLRPQHLCSQQHSLCGFVKFHTSERRRRHSSPGGLRKALSGGELAFWRWTGASRLMVLA